MPLANSFAWRLKSARQAAGLTQKQLADRVGLKSQATIGMLESGERKESRRSVQLAHALGVSAMWLIAGQGPRHPTASPKNQDAAFNDRMLTSDKIKASSRRVTFTRQFSARLANGNMDYWPFSAKLYERTLKLADPDLAELESALEHQLRLIEARLARADKKQTKRNKLAL